MNYRYFKSSYLVVIPDGSVLGRWLVQRMSAIWKTNPRIISVLVKKKKGCLESWWMWWTWPADYKRLRPLSPSAGVPQPDIVWYKDAVPIGPVKYPRYRVLVGGSLQVNGLLPDDTGMFQCFARNAAGEVQTNTYLAVTSECSGYSSLKSFLLHNYRCWSWMCFVKTHD